MEDDEGEICVRMMEATADQFRDAAKVAMDRVPGADDVAAAKLKTEAKACIKMAELLESRGVNCLAKLPALH